MLSDVFAIHTLVLIPVYYTLYKRWEQWKESRMDRDDESTEQLVTEAETVGVE